MKNIQRLITIISIPAIIFFVLLCKPETENPKENSFLEMGTKSDLPNFGPAPEFSNEIWLNTDTPPTLSDLRGKVVLLDMWTFG